MGETEHNIYTDEYGELPRVSEPGALLELAGAFRAILAPGVPDPVIGMHYTDEGGILSSAIRVPPKDYSDIWLQAGGISNIGDIIEDAWACVGREDIEAVTRPIITKYLGADILRDVTWNYDHADYDDMLNVITTVISAVKSGADISPELQADALRWGVNCGSSEEEEPEAWDELEEHANHAGRASIERAVRGAADKAVLRMLLDCMPGGSRHGDFGVSVFALGWDPDFRKLQGLLDDIMDEQGFGPRFDPGLESWMTVPSSIADAAIKNGTSFYFIDAEDGAMLWGGSNHRRDLFELFAEAYSVEAPAGFKRACEPLACVVDGNGVPVYLVPRGVGAHPDTMDAAERLKHLGVKPASTFDRIRLLGFVYHAGWWHGPYIKEP